jgi:hypothetical protein
MAVKVDRFFLLKHKQVIKNFYGLSWQKLGLVFSRSIGNISAANRPQDVDLAHTMEG